MPHRSLDDHLAGELHAGGAQVQLVVGVFAEAAQAAVHVAHRGVKEDAADEGQDGVADPPVRPHHRACLDASGEAVAHHQVVAFAQLGDERSNGQEVVAVVGVTHDHELASRRLDAADQGAAVALARHVDDTHPQLPGHRQRAVGAAVVGDDDLRRQAVFLDCLLRLADADGQRLGLVEARHDDRDFDFGRWIVLGLAPRTLRYCHGLVQRNAGSGS